ncbi:Lsr2 family protein [Spirillospora sp. NPDC127200]
MATITRVTLTDDLDGTEATETITFALDGATYEIDLSGDNALRLRETLEPFVAKGRPIKSRRTYARSSTAPKTSATSAEIRAWAKNINPHWVTDRGRIPFDVVEKYNAAHNL